MKKFISLLLTAALLLSSLAFGALAADSGSTDIGTQVPSKHTVTIDCGSYGSYMVDGYRISPTHRYSIERFTDVKIIFYPADGYAVDTITYTGIVSGTVVQGRDYILIPNVVGELSVSATFKYVGHDSDSGKKKTAEPEKIIFTDVPEGSYYYDAVRWAVDTGVTSGTSATTFSPGVTCTRADAVTFLWRIAGAPAPNGSSEKFTDVVPGSYYDKAVAWGIENGIVKGTSPTTFSPFQPCTRGQIAAFIARYAGIPDGPAVTKFTDVSPNAYYAAAIQWMTEHGITEGTSDTTFSPDYACARAHIITFLYRYAAK